MISDEWVPQVQYGFSKVPVVQKAENALYWVKVRARLDIEAIARKCRISEASA